MIECAGWYQRPAKRVVQKPKALSSGISFQEINREALVAGWRSSFTWTFSEQPWSSSVSQELLWKFNTWWSQATWRNKLLHIPVWGLFFREKSESPLTHWLQHSSIPHFISFSLLKHDGHSGRVFYESFGSKSSSEGWAFPVHLCSELQWHLLSLSPC